MQRILLSCSLKLVLIYIFKNIFTTEKRINRLNLNLDRSGFKRKLVNKERTLRKELKCSISDVL